MASKNKKLPNCNLYLTGFGTDINGNRVVKLKYPSGNGFSIQTNANMKNTHKLAISLKPNQLSSSDILTIRNECVSYIEKYGSQLQKSKLITT